MKKSALANSHKRLIELMQRINYGTIERLHVAKGEPCFDPAPRVVREIKFSAENGARHEQSSNDFQLKAQVVDLIAQMRQINDAVILKLEIKAGLPFSMTVEEHAA